MTASTPPDRLDVRPLVDGSELDRFVELPYSINHELAEDLEVGRRRPAWLWLALLDGVVVARAGWWGVAGGDRPVLLDLFHIRNAANSDHVDAARVLSVDTLDQVVGRDRSGLGYIRCVVAELA